MSRPTYVANRFFLALAGLCLATALNAEAEIQVKVVGTDPAAETSLGRDQPFYVRIEFSTDEPINIWARPYFKGKAIERAKFNASHKYSGTGQALGWFSLDGPSEVDEVHIILGGGKPWREWVAVRYPVKIAGTGLAPALRTNASWVDELRRETEVAQRREFENRINEIASAGDFVFMSGFMLLMLSLLLAGFGAPAWAWYKWRGGWRIAALAPALLMAFVVLRIMRDTARDPTSHNLWPFEILMFGLVSLGIILGLAIARRVVATKK
jgi:hypothetical protein